MTTQTATTYTINYKTSRQPNWLRMRHTSHNLAAAREYITRYMVDQLRLHPTLDQRYMIDQQGVGPVEAGELLSSGRLVSTTLSYSTKNVKL